MDDAFRHQVLDKGEPHVRNSGGAVQPSFLLHLQDDVLHGLALVFCQVELIRQRFVAFDQLGGRETGRNAGSFRVIFDQVDDAVNRPVYGAAVLIFAAEVPSEWSFLIFRHVQRVIHQFLQAVPSRRGDGYDGNAQQRFHAVYVDGTSVAAQFVHHVQRQHHRHVQFHELHRQVQAALDAGRVQNIDDARRLFIEDEVA